MDERQDGPHCPICVLEVAEAALTIILHPMMLDETPAALRGFHEDGVDVGRLDVDASVLEADASAVHACEEVDDEVLDLCLIDRCGFR